MIFHFKKYYHSGTYQCTDYSGYKGFSYKDIIEVIREGHTISVWSVQKKRDITLEVLMRLYKRVNNGKLDLRVLNKDIYYKQIRELPFKP